MMRHAGSAEPPPSRPAPPLPYGAADLVRVHPVLLLRALALASGSALAVTTLIASLGLFTTAPLPVPEVEIAGYDIWTPPPVAPRRAPAPPVMPSAPKEGTLVAAPDTLPAAIEEPVEATGPALPGEPTNGGSPSPGAQPGGPTGDDRDTPSTNIIADELPVVVVRVPPEYPELARRAGVEGVVVLHALVGRDGRVLKVRILASHPLLDAAAEEAVAQWVFVPAKTAGRPVPVWVSIPLRFSLR